MQAPHPQSMLKSHTQSALTPRLQSTHKPCPPLTQELKLTHQEVGSYFIVKNSGVTAKVPISSWQDQILRANIKQRVIENQVREPSISSWGHRQRESCLLDNTPGTEVSSLNTPVTASCVTTSSDITSLSTPPVTLVSTSSTVYVGEDNPLQSSHSTSACITPRSTSTCITSHSTSSTSTSIPATPSSVTVNRSIHTPLSDDMDDSVNAPGRKEMAPMHAYSWSNILTACTSSDGLKGYVTSINQLEELMLKYQLETGTKFVSHHTDRPNFGKTDIKEMIKKTNKVHLVESGLAVTKVLEYDGVPYILLNMKIWECRHGPERQGHLKERIKNASKIMFCRICNLTFKQGGYKGTAVSYHQKSKDHQRRLKKLSNQTDEDVIVVCSTPPSHLSAQPLADSKRVDELLQRSTSFKSRKLGCKQKIYAKEVLKFPRHKIDPHGDPKLLSWHQRLASKKVKKSLECGDFGERRFYVSLPDLQGHNHPVGDNGRSNGAARCRGFKRKLEPCDRERQDDVEIIDVLQVDEPEDQEMIPVEATVEVESTPAVQVSIHTPGESRKALDQPTIGPVESIPTLGESTLTPDETHFQSPNKSSCVSKEKATYNPLIDLDYEQLINEEDRHTALGQHVVNNIRVMSADQQVIAEKLITDVLFEGRLGVLNTDTRLHIPSLRSDLQERNSNQYLSL